MTLSEQLVEWVDRALTRRQFLARLSMAVLGAAVTWIEGRDAQALAAGECTGGYIRGCCVLCCPPGSALDALPNCIPRSPYRTRWCWYCVDSRGFSYKCCEAHEPDVPADKCDECDKVFASWYVFLGPHHPED